MPQLIESPVCFHDDAIRGEEIKEYVGRISTGTDEISIGILQFPEGWSEPPQTPEFDEYTVVLEGTLYVDSESVGTVVVRAGQGILTPKGERIQYRTPEPGGARYLGVCLPAFAPELAHREEPGAEIPKTEKPQWSTKSRIVFCRRPTIFQGAGMNTRQVEEFFGLFNNNATAISIARLKLWSCSIETRGLPSFDNHRIVMKGALRVTTGGGDVLTLQEGQAVKVNRGERVCFDSPNPTGSEYLSVCLSAYDRDFIVYDGDSMLIDSAVIVK